MSAEAKVAFVLGGGGHLGAHQVGMLAALLEHGIRPDLVVGTSIGAINGAAVAADPGATVVERMEAVWQDLDARQLFGRPLLLGLPALLRRRTHLHDGAPLRRLIEDVLAVRTFEELAVPFHCVAASIERAAEHWFDSGPLVEAILASCAVPGIFPPVEIAGEHFVDGGMVNSIPVGRAVALGATDVYVLQVGRVERPLEPPRNPLQVALVAFEIARRHRFAHDLEHLPEGVQVHVLPTGGEPPRFDDLSQLRYRDFSEVPDRIARAREATAAYLEDGSLAG